MSLLSTRLAVLTESANQQLTRLRKGLEKESLRVTPEGTLAQTGHPRGLGSALTHPAITTDYSEALLEFITEPHARTESMLQELDRIQRFTYECLDDETLWVGSMPCMLTSDANIPIARYGSSNPGLMKSIYRLGLGIRYGRSMQTIAGIHYNFSLDDAFWEYWHQREAGNEPFRDYKNRRYFDLIRNFRRYFWILLYLFGASPAVCRSFVKGREHRLTQFGADEHSLHLPFATSLRMGDLGYQSDAQSSLVVSYNDLDSYINTLCGAITQPHPAYVERGLRDADGHYKQLNTCLLQIENEFYSTIRPKCVARSGETALGALRNRGVDYIEVRCVDLNPYEPLGINAEQIYFMDVFLVYCLLADSPKSNVENYRRSLENQRRVVARGRDPEMRLLSPCGELFLPQWGNLLLEEMTAVAAVLDRSHDSQKFSRALRAQRDKLKHPELTPSAQILADMASAGETFFRFTMNQSRAHAQNFRLHPLDEGTRNSMQEQARESLRKQAQAESQPQQDFDHYLADYYAQYDCCTTGQ